MAKSIKNNSLLLEILRFKSVALAELFGDGGFSPEKGRG